MRFSRIRLAVCAVVVAGLSSMVAEATLIDVQILGQSAGNPTMPPSYSGAAVTGSAGDVWNGYVVDSGTNGIYSPGTMALVDVAGAATTAQFQLTTAGGDNQAVGAGATGNALADSYAFAYTAPVSVGFEIAGFVPNSVCDLYLYATPGNWGSGDTSYTVNGVTKNATNSGQFTSVGWVEDNNYVHYASLLADANGKISGSLDWKGSVDHASFLNGLQVEGTLAVPEPGILALLASGVLGLLAYAWRKRR